MTRPRKPARTPGKASTSSKDGPRQPASGKAPARPVSRSARAGESAPGTGSIGRDGKLHIQPGSVRKPKTDGRPAPASRRRTGTETEVPEAAPTRAGTRPRTEGKRPNPPRQRGPQLDSPPSGTTFRDRDGKTHTFPDSALKRIAAQLLTERGKKWRYRPFGFPIFSPSGSEQELHFDFYVYDNMDSIFKLILLMPRESRETWDRVGRFKQQYPMYHYELWTPDHLAKVMGPKGKLGW